MKRLTIIVVALLDICAPVYAIGNCYVYDNTQQRQQCEIDTLDTQRQYDRMNQQMQNVQQQTQQEQANAQAADQAIQQQQQNQQIIDLLKR